MGLVGRQSMVKAKGVPFLPIDSLASIMSSLIEQPLLITSIHAFLGEVVTLNFHGPFLFYQLLDSLILSSLFQCQWWSFEFFWANLGYSLNVSSPSGLFLDISSSLIFIACWSAAIVLSFWFNTWNVRSGLNGCTVEKASHSMGKTSLSVGKPFQWLEIPQQFGNEDPASNRCDGGWFPSTLIQCKLLTIHIFWHVWTN